MAFGPRFLTFTNMVLNAGVIIGPALGALVATFAPDGNFLMAAGILGGLAVSVALLAQHPPGTHTRDEAAAEFRCAATPCIVAVSDRARSCAMPC